MNTSLDIKSESHIDEFEMSSTEVAALLQVTRRSVVRFAAEGKLASCRKDNKLFFKKGDVEDFARQRGIIQRPTTVPSGNLTVAQLISNVQEEVNALKAEISTKQQLLADREKFLADLQTAERS